jgi:hypothetical protein
MNEITEGDLQKRFTYHAPKEDQPVRYQQIRNMAYSLAEYIVINTKPSREQSLAITHIEDAVMWANAGIARNE